MAKKDYYDVLGVERGADEKAIKRAYKKLAMQYHPDRTKGDKAKEEKFKEIQEAYEILGDKEKRAAYDQYGHAAFEQGGGGDGGDAYLFPADRDTRGCADNTVAESALSGTEGSQKTDGPAAGTIPGIP